MLAPPGGRAAHPEQGGKRGAPWFTPGGDILGLRGASVAGHSPKGSAGLQSLHSAPYTCFTLTRRVVCALAADVGTRNTFGSAPLCRTFPRREGCSVTGAGDTPGGGAGDGTVARV